MYPTQLQLYQDVLADYRQRIVERKQWFGAGLCTSIDLAFDARLRAMDLSPADHRPAAWAACAQFERDYTVHIAPFKRECGFLAGLPLPWTREGCEARIAVLEALLAKLEA